MKIFLFSSLNIFPLNIITLFPDAAPEFKFTPPLGLFCLAGALKERRDCATRIIDLNREAAVLGSVAGELLPKLYDAVKKIIVTEAVPGEKIVVGFQTLCTSHHVALYLAERIKTDYPEVIVLFGGPQASAVAEKTLKLFPYVDYVIAGEADLAFPLFADAMLGLNSIDSVGGLYFRGEAGEIRSTGPSLLPDDLDKLPFPDYDSYPYPVGGYLVEAGRGCPYNCSYCFTGKYFSRKCRYKSAARIGAELSEIKKKYGAVGNVSFQHDNLFGNQASAETLCKELKGLSKQIGFKWSCFIRLDAIRDLELGHRLVSSGCNRIFLGIESGSPRIQKMLNKYHNVDAAYSIIPALHTSGLQLDLGFMTEFPEETPEDVEKTLRLVSYSRLYDANYQINPLMIYSGTRVFEQCQKQLTYDPGRDTTDYNLRFFDFPESHEMFKTSPEIFSVFYSFPLEHPELKGLATLAHFLSRSFTSTCLAIVFWSSHFKRLVDIYILLKPHWSSDRESFITAFKKWVTENFSKNRPIMELFRYEMDCYESVLTDKYLSSVGRPKAEIRGIIEKEGFSDLVAVRGNRVRHAKYALTHSAVSTLFKKALSTGVDVPEPVLTEDGKSYFLKGVVNKTEKYFNIEVFRFPAVSGKIFEAVTSRQSSIRVLKTELLQDVTQLQMTQWLSLLFEKELISFVPARDTAITSPVLPDGFH